MKRLLAGLALTAMLGATPSMAFDAAQFRQLLTTKWCEGCNLIGADLRSADLSGADLSGARLGGANLTNADLTDAILRGADLFRADLSGAILSGADLGGGAFFDGPERWCNTAWVDGTILNADC